MSEGPDSIRAWYIAVVVMFLNMICSGIWRSSGYLFVAFLDEYNIDRQRAVIPLAIRITMRNFLGPVAGVLGEKYGVRPIVVLGGILGTISSALCFFTTDIIWVTLIFGVINGASEALIIVLPYVLLGQYFNKYRTTACGLSYTGASISSFIFPSLIEMLLNKYGLNGTFLIIGGMILHSVPLAITLTKPDWMKNDGINTKFTVCRTMTDDSKSSKTSKHFAKYFQYIAMWCSSSKATYNCQEQKRIKNLNFLAQFNEHLPCRRNINSMKHDSKCIPPDEHSSLENSTSLISYTTINDKVITLYCGTAVDIDIEYLKEQCDLVFEMIIMDLSSVELSYPELSRDEPQKECQPTKNEIFQQIENLFLNIKDTLETKYNLNCANRSNDKHISGIPLNERSSLKHKYESFQQREHKCNTIYSIPNIYRTLKEMYILKKLQILCKSNEAIITSRLTSYNPMDVLKVIFQVRGLYKLYENFSNVKNSKCAGVSKSMMNCDGSRVKEVSSTLKETEKQRNYLVQYMKSVFMLYKNKIYLMISFARLTFFVTMCTVLHIIIDFARDRGIPEDDGKFLIGALSIGDLLGRLCSGWITDCGYLTLAKCMLCALVCLGISTISLSFATSTWILLVPLFFFGLAESSHQIRHPVLIAKYMSSQEQSIAMGCLEFPSALFNLLMPFYIGYFRDNVGSYDAMFYINGCVAILAGLCWTLEPYVSDKNISASTNL